MWTWVAFGVLSIHVTSFEADGYWPPKEIHERSTLTSPGVGFRVSIDVDTSRPFHSVQTRSQVADRGRAPGAVHVSGEIWLCRLQRPSIEQTGACNFDPLLFVSPQEGTSHLDPRLKYPRNHQLPCRARENVFIENWT